MANDVLARMAVQIVANNAQFAVALRQSQAQMQGFQKTAQTLGTTLQGIGVGLGLMELARGIQFAIKTAADFQATMSEVRAITGATGKEFKALEDDAKRLGGSTRYTATQVAQLQIAYGRLGFSTKEILDATEATLMLAAATGEDLAKSADVAGSTVRGFGLDATETLRVVDVMASSFNKTALGLDNFTESMKYVAPVANAAGATVEEATAMLGVLADAGIRGSMAGTSLRKIFTDMTKDGRPLQERLAELAAKGITLADSFDEVGRTAQTSLLILSKNTEKTNELTKALQNSAGEASKMAEIMQDNLTGDVTKLNSAVEGLILKFVDGEGALRDFIQALTDLVVLASDDGFIKGMKAWFDLVTIVPRKTLQVITSIIDAFKDEADAFEQMQADRRKLWEEKTKKLLDDEIKKTNEAADAAARYAAMYANLLKIASFKKPGLARNTGVHAAVEDEFYHRPIDMDPLSSMNLDLENPVPGIGEEIEYNEELAASLSNLNKLREEQIEKMQRTADMAVTMGEAMGSALEGMLDGSLNLAQGLARVTEEIITMYLRQSIAAMIKNSIEAGGPIPFAGIALATAGIGLVKGLFSKIGAGGRSVAGGSVPGRTPSQMNIRVTGHTRGYDTAYTLDKEGYRRGRFA